MSVSSSTREEERPLTDLFLCFPSGLVERRHSSLVSVGECIYDYIIPVAGGWHSEGLPLTRVAGEMTSKHKMNSIA